MGRYLGPVCKLCRREQQQLFLKGTKCLSDKCAITKRRPIPGGMSARKKTKLSEYGVQLREKQKVKRIYSVLEKQFSNSYDNAQRKKGKTGENLLIVLESRLDNIIYRGYLANSRMQARQIIRHGQILINGEKVNIPSYLVKPGDVVEIKEKNKKMRLVLEALKNAKRGKIPSWMEVNEDEAKINIITLPTRTDIQIPINEQLIVELYSK